MILQKARYFLKESLHNLWQFKTRHVVSLTIIGLSFVVLGVFLTVSNNLRFRAWEISKDLTVTFYLKQTVPAGERGLIVDQVQRSPLVGTVRSVSPEEAADKFAADFPDLKSILLNLNANPFPASIEVGLKDPGLPTETVLRFIDEVKKNAAVEDVQFNREWADKIRSLGRLADAVGLFLGGILVLASFFIISNVIKLNVLARKNEIEILRLVGATNTFIRTPFLFEGVILGAAGGALSLLVVLVLIKLFPLYLGSSLGALQEIIGFRYLTLSQALALVFGGAGVGLLGGLTSLARFLRI